MTTRDRWTGVLQFKKPDRIPLIPGGGRQSTLAAWRAQGLPENVADYVQHAYREAGGRLPWPAPGGGGFTVNERMMPTFEECILEERENSRVVQDWKGNVCEIGKAFTPEYLRNAIDFVTRRWIKCPVESRDDWEAMKRRYDADDASRLPEHPAEQGRRLTDRAHPVVLHFSGPFWQLREWLGFENLCMLCCDDPLWVEEMIRFWEAYVSRLMERTFACFTPDMVHLSEDMAYKQFSMISPAMVRRFLLPTWRRWGEQIRRAGVPLYGMDSDGFIGELIPLWIEAGINVCDPVEVAAGNDLPAFRRRFGRDMAYTGGVDKRAMAKGGRAIEAEIERLRPVIEDGGYIPGCDHGVPSDVSWPNYVRY
ncbi:MAG: hypothetical protein GX590_08625, partial [Lentisphaerae bacterium]|nr:hypothetical protein [Lentisphaerota bacterium]